MRRAFDSEAAAARASDASAKVALDFGATAVGACRLDWRLVIFTVNLSRACTGDVVSMGLSASGVRSIHWRPGRSSVHLRGRAKSGRGTRALACAGIGTDLEPCAAHAGPLLSAAGRLGLLASLAGTEGSRGLQVAWRCLPGRANRHQHRHGDQILRMACRSGSLGHPTGQLNRELLQGELAAETRKRRWVTGRYPRSPSDFV